MEFWDMDDRRETRHRQGRAGPDFIGGIDNEGLDFSQLEDFINSEGSQGNSTYFGESLNSNPSGKLLNVIVENKRNSNNNNNNTQNTHSLPESPPDSSSEHPYSPQDGCEARMDSIYSNIAQGIYKPGAMLNPILTDNLILGSHIVVTDQNNEQLLDNGNILQENPLLGNNAGLTRILTENIQNDADILQDRIILPEGNVTDNGRPILLTASDSNQNFAFQSATLDQQRNNNAEQNLENIQSVYTNLSTPKKRKLSQDSPLVKSEPEHCTTSQLSPSEQLNASIEEEYASSEACLSESQYQCIRFNAFQQSNWHLLCDQNLTELPAPHYRVDADKGFNFSNADDAFVCQKKNHFQITCHVQLLGDAQFVKTPDGFQKISSFHLHFYGVKHDCPTQTIRVEQSQSDRSKKPFHPVLVELVSSQVTKVTVGRLHFSETTSNNMRKKGKPNPEQRYFQLVVGLHAHTTSGNYPVISHASQKIIVRASNPGQFESDVELCWQKGQTQDSVVHNGRVGINTDRPDESLVVHGNIKITGHIIQPSDLRAKKNIVELNTAEQLRNVQRLRVVRYEYEPTFASQLNQDARCVDTGVIAQEVAQVLPEAVRPAGDLTLPNGKSVDNFLVVNKERIFMENIGAVKELCKVTDNLVTRIDQLERINRRLNKLKRGDSLKSTSTLNSSKSSPCPPHKCLKYHHSRHSCYREDEVCSNKIIQIVIVILVLIMAFCLAAITTLYLMETARHSSQYLQPNVDVSHRSMSTKRPTKSGKVRTWISSTSPSYPTTNRYKEDDSLKISIEENLINRPSYIIGRPIDCLNVEQDLESTNLCQIYCCVNPPQKPLLELSPVHSTEKKLSLIRNKTTLAINIEKNKIPKPYHSNVLEKKMRQRRDTFTDEANFFDTPDDQRFTISIHGTHFNTTLTHKYRIPVSNPQYNFTYSVPISKYMPDEFINLIFRSNQANIKEIDHCYNDFKQYECPFLNSHQFYDDKRMRHKVNENSPSQLLGYQSIIFEVDMLDFQSKFMTYRASLRPNQNICKLSSTKLGLEFIEYNFHFYRHCDE